MPNNQATTASDIPAAPYYVTCTDAFMSGWGHSEGKANRLIFPCESQEEAWIVYDNAQGRSEQKNVRICEGRKPRLNSYGYLYQVMDRDDAKPWYVEGTWKP